MECFFLVTHPGDLTSQSHASLPCEGGRSGGERAGRSSRGTNEHQARLTSAVQYTRGAWAPLYGRRHPLTEGHIFSGFGGTYVTSTAARGAQCSLFFFARKKQMSIRLQKEGRRGLLGAPGPPSIADDTVAKVVGDGKSLSYREGQGVLTNSILRSVRARAIVLGRASPSLRFQWSQDIE